MIPKNLYFVHLGGREIPPEYQANIDGWKSLMPDWTVSVITEENRPKSQCEDIYEALPHFVAKCDVDRVNILYKLGGVYLDYDMEPHRSLTPILESGCGLSISYVRCPSHEEGHKFEHAFLAMEAGHTFGAHWLSEFADRMRSRQDEDMWYEYIAMGLGLWGEIIDEAGKPSMPHRKFDVREPVWVKDALILPHTSFYLMQSRETRWQCEEEAKTCSQTYALHNSHGQWKIRSEK